MIFIWLLSSDCLFKYMEFPVATFCYGRLISIGGGASISMLINVYYVYFGLFMKWVYINIHKLKDILKRLCCMYEVSQVR